MKKTKDENTIYDPLPLEVVENLAELREDLDQKVPFKELDRNLLIATWNIRGFGNFTRKWMSAEKDSPRRDLHSIFCIAEILSRFDVIAVQEVKGNLRALRDTLKLLGDNWSMILTDTNKSDSGNDERMAYLFDTRRVQLSGLAGEIVIPNEWVNDPDKVLREQFVRSPYAVSFRSGDKTFILVTVHIIYGKKSKDRLKEIHGIARWLNDWAGDINAYDQNLIVLGDFNIDARGDVLDQTFLSEGLYVPEELQSLSRSIFDETKYYDQIAWFNSADKKRPKLSLEFMGAGNYDFVQTALNNRGLTKQKLSFMISDHYPLWANFRI
jgi:endonuclease/exonuclease/phosphatase family metal-dependent hydrolase